jgi:hypothetical protein
MQVTYTWRNIKSQRGGDTVCMCMHRAFFTVQISRMDPYNFILGVRIRIRIRIRLRSEKPN